MPPLSSHDALWRGGVPDARRVACTFRQTVGRPAPSAAEGSNPTPYDAN